MGFFSCWKIAILHKNLGHFIQLKPINLQSLNTVISFDIICLLINVPVNEALQVIRNKLHNNDTLVERSVLQDEAIIELLEVCLRTTYFKVDDNFFQQKDGNGSITHCDKIYMENFEKLPLHWAQHKSLL
jgi:hypothetical protein